MTKISIYFLSNIYNKCFILSKLVKQNFQKQYYDLYLSISKIFFIYHNNIFISPKLIYQNIYKWEKIIQNRYWGQIIAKSI